MMKSHGRLLLSLLAFAVHLSFTRGQTTLFGGTSVNVGASVTAAAGAGASASVQGTTVQVPCELNGGLQWNNS